MKPVHVIFVVNVFVAGLCTGPAIGLGWFGNPVGAAIVAFGAVANVACASTAIPRLLEHTYPR